MKRLFAFILTFSLVMGIIPVIELSVMAEGNLFNLSAGAIRIENGTATDTIKVIQGAGAIYDNISKGSQITITGSYSSSSGGSGDVIYIAPGVTANIKLSNANINIDYYDGNRHAFYIDRAEVTVELFGANILRSSSNNNAGLHVSGGASVTIVGDGSLTAGQNGYCGSGIGGDSGNITINSGTITAMGYWGAGIGVGSGNITINGGTINATGRYGAGIGSIDSGTLVVNVTINGGTIIASGGSYAAGIGSGNNNGTNKGGSITINGGNVTATGSYGAAIGGGGYDSLSCPIAVNGGVVTANTIGGTGSYSNSPNNGAFTMNGNAVVFATSVSDKSPKTKGILFIGNSGVMYGDVTVEYNVTISNNMTLALYTGTLTIATGVTLTNNGTILLGEGTSILCGGNTYGTLNGSGQTKNMVTIAEILGVAAPVSGAIPATTVTETSQYTGTVKWLPYHSQFKAGTGYTATITLTAKPGFSLAGVPANFFKVAGATAVNSNGSGIITAVFSATNIVNSIFDMSDGAIRIEKGTNTSTIKVLRGSSLVKDNILKETQITITGTYSNSTVDGIYVAPEVTANIMFCNTNISAYCAFNMSGANVNLEVAGENTFISNDSNSAGLRVPTGATVTIFGGGTLTARGGSYGAGIGGNNTESAGNITINGGTISTYSSSFGAGIGGGYSGTVGNIIINNGIITASGGSYGAGIGNGYNNGTNKGGSITINGGNVTATGSSGAGIGAGGYDGLSCPIAVNGGVVTANTIGGTGSYSNATNNGAFTMNGNALVFATSVSDKSPKTKGILFIDNCGVMYGNVTVEQDVTISNNMTLALYTGTLTIATGVTLTNNGTILLGEGTSVLCGGNTYGTLNGSGQTKNMVTIAEILGVAAPVSGATPATTVTETSQYTGTVKWLPDHSQFKAGTGYTATITLTTKSGFVLTGVPANFFKVAGATAVNSTSSGVITAVFSATDVTNNLFDMSDGPIRIENGSAFNTIKIKYGKGLVKDYLAPNTPITITGNYLGDSTSLVDAIYVSRVANIKMNNVSISVNANSRNAFILDGASVTMELIGENSFKSGSSAAGLLVPTGSSLTIIGTGSLVSIGGSGGAGIGGNSSGACGAVTIYGGVVNAQGGYSAKGIGSGSGNSTGGTLTINGNSVVFATSVSDNSPKTKGILFVGNNGVMYDNVMVEHNVTISNSMTLVLYTGTLTVAPGVTLTNNGMILLGEGTSVLSGGASYGIVNGSGQMQNMVTISEILGVTAPVTGATPVTTVTETSQYTGTVKWSPNHSQFKVGTGYTATITLTAKPGYVLNGVPANFFKVAGATAVNTSGSGVITTIFSATNVANSIFDITNGAIRIEKGTNTNTIKVLCGGSLVKDNIPKETQITITGTYSNGSGDGIYVSPGVTANIMLCNINISSYCAFNMAGASVNLELAGENTLNSSDSMSAGLHAPTGASLTIFGGGTLTARGSGWGAGIGGNNTESAGNITINGGTITTYGNSFGAGIGGGAYGGTGGNIIVNNGIITTYGYHGAGIGGGMSGTPGNITINGGTITASGGSYGAGIGNGYSNGTNKSDSITINGGTITATGSSGAAIGAGGYDGLSCPIAINGGVVNANSIGGTGSYSTSPNNGAFTMNGNGIVYALSVSDNSSKTKGILYIGNSGTVYGSVEFKENAIIASGKTLQIQNSSSLTIPGGVTLTNNGVIINNGSLINNGSINNYNTIGGTGAQTGNSSINIIDMTNNTPPNSGNGWLYTSNVYTVLDGANLLITGTNATGRRIEVEANAKANITLNDVSISGRTNYDPSPLLLKSGANVNLTIKGNNTMISGNNGAGIQVPKDTNLTITAASTGKLTAKGSNGAGIGGGSDGASGTIIINGGTIIANGGYASSGIGGGLNSSVGTISIDGNCIVFSSSIKGTQMLTKGILFIGNNGAVYGDVTLENDLEVGKNYVLTVLDNAMLTIPISRTLTNNGTVIPANGSAITVLGTVLGNKINGTNVEIPVISSIPTQTSITMSAVGLLAATEQGVEYAVSSLPNVDPTTLLWQDGTTFSGLSSDTNYVCARSKSTLNFSTGLPSLTIVKPEISISITAVDKVTVSYATPQSATVVIAFYENGKLLKMALMPVIQSGIGKFENVTIFGNADKIKVMMWEGIDNTKPLCGAVTKTKNSNSF